MFWGQLKNDRNKEPVQCFCAGSCFDVPMCGALVQGISCIGLKNAKWCVVRTWSFSQTHTSVPHK